MVSDKVDYLAGNGYGRDEIVFLLVPPELASIVVNANHSTM
jgi:hypothetical protein